MKLLKIGLLLGVQVGSCFSSEPAPVLTSEQIAAGIEIHLLVQNLQRQGALASDLRLLDLISQELSSLHTKDCYHKQK